MYLAPLHEVDGLFNRCVTIRPTKLPSFGLDTLPGDPQTEQRKEVSPVGRLPLSVSLLQSTAWGTTESRLDELLKESIVADKYHTR